MTTKEADEAERIKKKIVDQLTHFLLHKDQKPEKVLLTVVYPESTARLELDLND